MAVLLNIAGLTVAFIIVAGVTLLTVSYQNRIAAGVNPVDSIKTE